MNNDNPKIEMTPELEQHIFDYWESEGQPSTLFKPYGFNEVSRSELVEYLQELEVWLFDSFSFSLYGKDETPELYRFKSDFDCHVFVFNKLKTGRMYIFNTVHIFKPLSMIHSINFKLLLTY